jgi:metal-responsive CopG/Arc/MetJ family transcriptional regulator
MVARNMRTVTVRLNQQQLELLDRTVEHVGAASRAEVLLRALREYARDAGITTQTPATAKAEAIDA